MGASGEPTEVDRYNREQAENSWKPDSIEMNGEEIAVYGVLHAPPTLQYYGTELETAVKKSSLVVLEVAPKAMGIFNSEVLDFFEENILHKNRKMSSEQWKIFFEKDPTIDFYRQMELLAAKHDKLVGQIYSFPKSDQKLLPLAIAEKYNLSIGNFKNIAAALSLILGDSIKYFDKEAADENQNSKRDWDLSSDFRIAGTVEGLDIITRDNIIRGDKMLVFGSDHVAPIKEHSLLKKEKTPHLTELKVQIFKPTHGGGWLIQELL